MKPFEEMTFQELKEAGLIHTTRLRNYQIIADYNRLRGQGYNREEALNLLSDQYNLSWDGVVYVVYQCSKFYGIKIYRDLKIYEKRKIPA